MNDLLKHVRRTHRRNAADLLPEELDELHDRLHAEADDPLVPLHNVFDLEA